MRKLNMVSWFDIDIHTLAIRVRSFQLVSVICTTLCWTTLGINGIHVSEWKCVWWVRLILVCVYVYCFCIAIQNIATALKVCPFRFSQLCAKNLRNPNNYFRITKTIKRLYNNRYFIQRLKKKRKKNLNLRLS